MSNFMCIRRSRNATARQRELEARVRQLNDLCSRNVENSTRLGVFQGRALRLLTVILRERDGVDLDRAVTRDLVSCAIRILSHYEDVPRDPRTCFWRRRRDYKTALTRYNDLVSSGSPELAVLVIEIIGEQALWLREHLCWELSRGLLDRADQAGTLIEGLLDRVESPDTRLKNARAVVRLLYEILDVHRWPKTPESVATIERLLTLYRASLENARWSSLRRGLEVCVRHAVKKLDNEHILVVIHRVCFWLINDEEVAASDSTVLNFGGILEHAAHAHSTRLYKDTLDSRLLPILMRMIASGNRLVSLLGNRVIHRLLDRHDNRAHFDTPKIFFQDTSHDLEVARCDKQDKNFLQANREILHDSLVRGLMRHCSVRMNLEAVYRTVCLIAVEVPCGFTAAAIVCLVMNVQNLTLQRDDMPLYSSYHVHATVMAIMSLLCWIHEARVFYTYVNEIMARRAESAPHLNPPIKSTYRFALNHVLWNKPELFFVDWEVRYGLWKCFRTREERRSGNDEPYRSDYSD